MAKTGRFGFLYGITHSDEESERDFIEQRAVSTLMQKFAELAEDGRDFIIRTRKTRANDGLLGEMFTNDVIRFKRVVWCALANYKTAEIGEHSLLPDDVTSHPPIERFWRIKSNDEDEWPVEIVKIGDVWFEESFAFDVDMIAYQRIEPPSLEELKKAVNNEPECVI